MKKLILVFISLPTAILVTGCIQSNLQLPKFVSSTEPVSPPATPKGNLSQKARLTQSPKGVEFNPQVWNESGDFLGGVWPLFYDSEFVRKQVIAEAHAIHTVTGANTVVLLFSVGGYFDWPNPGAQKLDFLVRIVNDLAAEGLRSVVNVGTHCTLPNSAIGPGEEPEHVGGHHIGDVVNGYELYWDMPYCADNNIELSRLFFLQILNALDAGLSNPDSVAYFVVSGSHILPFNSEFGPLWTGYPHLQQVQNFLTGVIPYLRSITRIPLAFSSMSANWLQGTPQSDQEYDFLTHVAEAVPWDYYDFIEITSYYGMDLQEIIRRVGPENTHKIVLADFRFKEAGDKYGLSIAQDMQWHLDQVRGLGLAGWWVWQYKDDVGLPGLRQTMYLGDSGGWVTDAVEIMKSDIGQPVVSRLGLGCDSLQCLWISGTDFSSLCEVTIYDPYWNRVALLTQADGLICADNLATTEIPLWIRQQYSTVNVVVTNGSSGKWSYPASVGIRPGF